MLLGYRKPNSDLWPIRNGANLLHVFKFNPNPNIGNIKQGSPYTKIWPIYIYMGVKGQPDETRHTQKSAQIPVYIQVSKIHSTKHAFKCKIVLVIKFW